MAGTVRRIFVEKKKGFDMEARALYRDLKDNLGITGLEGVRIINRYDVEGISDDEYEAAKKLVFSEPPVDLVWDEEMDFGEGSRVFAVEYLPGQYDQRADSASQCIQMLFHGERPAVRVAKVVVLQGSLPEKEFKRIREYCINPVESREASMEKPETLAEKPPVAEDVEVLTGFIKMSRGELEALAAEKGLAMSMEDLEFCQDYYKNQEKRDPTITELRVIDTYWSDHCRHTTFNTCIDEIRVEDGKYAGILKKALKSYFSAREKVYAGQGGKDITLMDLATMGMKEMKSRGLLDDLEQSDEINASSIRVQARIDGKTEEWLVMFKNETHNHPTEIEPFGGAATCLGGAIRDPLSGRVYVYQAMRVTGSGDPRRPVKDTLPGKLPQIKITTGAAAGYSSYGNQVGLATGQVAEIYDEGYVAKRMELGAVIGAAPSRNVVRGKPAPGDVVILLGGRTGRDGCGGATGSSKQHDETSLAKSGPEVQKGNPPIERKIQRLFRDPEVSVMIKKCNDFGAGGVSVAIGELADSLDINLDAVPRKYEGLDGTELAISESQERMAVMVDAKDAERFMAKAREENLEAVPVAEVTDSRRLRMFWRGKCIVDIARDFLATNGVKRHTKAFIASPDEGRDFFRSMPKSVEEKLCNLKDAWKANLERLDVCSQRGLVERFDSTIGAGTVLMPFGGRYQLSPAEGMAAKLPVLHGETSTATLMSFGFNPSLSSWSPFNGSVYAVVEAVAKIAAMGGDYSRVRLTLQEYFEKLGHDPVKWGKPLSALLGAFYAQSKLGIPSVGGKDSMSGTFKDMGVPPTLVAFAVGVADVKDILSVEFKKAGSKVIYLELPREDELPDFEAFARNCRTLYRLAGEGKILAASTVKAGGIAEAVTKMCFGNMIGIIFDKPISPIDLFAPRYGSFILEIDGAEDEGELFKGIGFKVLGRTSSRPSIDVNGVSIDLNEALESWEKPLGRVFPTEPSEKAAGKPREFYHDGRGSSKAAIRIAKPRVFMPVFPGTNCEYDTARAFEKAGALVNMLVIRNLTPQDVRDSVELMSRAIDQSQIIVIPGGFSAGDEPEGSGKFVAAAFKNPMVRDAVMRLLKQRGGLILGICNGFQALIKLGLLPYGEIRDMNGDSPTLTYNTLGRHVSRMVRTKVVSNLSPWLANCRLGEVYTIPVSHGEGRFAASRDIIQMLEKNGQIATQYVDLDGNPTYDARYNPNGSLEAIEGITSPDGRILGKMGHSERKGPYVAVNVPGEKDQKIFEAGVEYFR